MSEYKNSIRTAAYEVSKDMKSQERKHKESKKLAKKMADKEAPYSKKGKKSRYEG